MHDFQSLQQNSYTIFLVFKFPTLSKNMSYSFFLFCFLNLNLVLAFRTESVQTPSNENKASDVTNGNRDGKRKSILTIAI